jgi:8-oxo-dGTP pyrophosphatase MutT (NUDIX family)
MAKANWRTLPGVRAVVLDDQGRVLLLLRPDTEALHPGTWSLPGGGKEPGEGFLEGASRELHEETGLTARPTGASTPYTYPGGKGKAFLFRHPEGAFVVDQRENREARWFLTSDLPHNLMPPTRALVTALAGSRSEPPMRNLTVTAERLRVEGFAADFIAPWLEASVRARWAALQQGQPLAKALGDEVSNLRRLAAPDIAEGRRMWLAPATGSDAEGEHVVFRTLVRARKLGMSEAAKALLAEADNPLFAPAGHAPPDAPTLAALKGIARRTVRQVNTTTDAKLAGLAARPEAADVDTLLGKLYDTTRSGLVGQDTVAAGYASGVADVLVAHGYAYAYSRPMLDDSVCGRCRGHAGHRYKLDSLLASLPWHPRCRCTPSASPSTDMAVPVGASRLIMKGLAPMTTSLDRLHALITEVPPAADLVKALHGRPDPAVLAAIAKKRRRGPGGQFASGKVTPDEQKQAQANPALDPEAPTPPMDPGKPARRIETPAGDSAQAKARGEVKAKPATTQAAVDTRTPQHLIQAGGAALAQLRTLKPGSPEFEHVRTQYMGIRHSIQAWNKSQGISADPLSESVTLPEKPSFVTGDLKTPKQFELAAAGCSTREEAQALGGYLEAAGRQDNHGTPYDGVWEAVKKQIQSLPKQADQAETRELTRAKAEGRKPKLTPDAPETPPMDEHAYGQHLDELNGHRQRMSKNGITNVEKSTHAEAFATKLHDVSTASGKAPEAVLKDARTPRKIGSGSVGDVFKDGDTAVKNANRGDGKSTGEGEVYAALKGATGVAPGRQEGDKIITPFYPKVVSVDTVPSGEREALGKEVAANAPRINAAVSALSEAGYYYGDPLQFGVDAAGKYSLLDFSNCSKARDPREARTDNGSLLRGFYQQFGAPEQGEKASTARHMLNGMQIAHESPGIADFWGEAVAKNHARVSQELGSAPRFAYHTDTPQQVPGASTVAASEAEGDHGHGVLSTKPLSPELIAKHQLTPVHHVGPVEAGAKPEAKSVTQAAPGHEPDDVTQAATQAKGVKSTPAATPTPKAVPAKAKSPGAKSRPAVTQAPAGPGSDGVFGTDDDDLDPDLRPGKEAKAPAEKHEERMEKLMDTLTEMLKKGREMLTEVYEEELREGAMEKALPIVPFLTYRPLSELPPLEKGVAHVDGYQRQGKPVKGYDQSRHDTMVHALAAKLAPHAESHRLAPAGVHVLPTPTTQPVPKASPEALEAFHERAKAKRRAAGIPEVVREPEKRAYLVHGTAMAPSDAAMAHGGPAGTEAFGKALKQYQDAAYQDAAKGREVPPIVRESVMGLAPDTRPLSVPGEVMRSQLCYSEPARRLAVLIDEGNGRGAAYVQQLKEAASEKHTPAQVKMYNALYDAATAFMVKQGEAIGACNDQLRQMLKADHPLDLNAIFSSDNTPESNQQVTPGIEAFKALVGQQPGEHNVVILTDVGRDRSNYNDADTTISASRGVSTDTIVHELGHWFEGSNPAHALAAAEFIQRRTAGATPEPMSKLAGNPQYDPSEIARPDKFPDPYCAKVYLKSDFAIDSGPTLEPKAVKATELVSTGLQMMYNDPVGLAKKDPEYFDLLWNMIRRTH